MNIESIKNILICFGGADPAFFTEYFVEKINDSKYNYKIVLGPAIPKNRKENILTIKKGRGLPRPGEFYVLIVQRLLQESNLDQKFRKLLFYPLN